MTGQVSAWLSTFSDDMDDQLAIDWGLLPRDAVLGQRPHIREPVAGPKIPCASMGCKAGAELR